MISERAKIARQTEKFNELSSITQKYNHADL